MQGSLKNDGLEIDTKTYIESITTNKKLQNVLAGTNILYAGAANKSPLFVHALIVNIISKVPMDLWMEVPKSRDIYQRDNQSRGKNYNPCECRQI